MQSIRLLMMSLDRCDCGFACRCLLILKITALMKSNPFVIEIIMKYLSLKL